MRRKIAWALVVCQFVCPLLFFTDLTRNPYFTQILLLNLGVLAAAALYVGGQEGSAWRLPRTPLDAPLLAWFALSLFTTLWAYYHHAPFFRDSIRAEGLRVGVFSVVNVLLPFFLAAACVDECSAEPDVNLGAWAGFVAAWGVLWMLFSTMRSAGGPALSVWTHLWDPYGALLWTAGLAAAIILVRRGTAHDYWHLALAAGFLSSMYGICQYFNAEFIWSRALNPYGGRAVSTFGNPNFMSSYIVVLLPLAVAYYLQARSLARRLVYAAVFLAMEACVVSSLTRSSWVGALLGLAVLFLSPELRRRVRENVEAHGLVAAAALAMILFWPKSTVTGYTPGVWGRVAELKSALNPSVSGTYSPLYQRVLIWSCMWLMGKENPLWGKGWGLLELFYPFYQGHMLSHYGLFATLRTHANNAHNEILEFWSQSGILGVGVLFWIWVVFFAGAWKWRGQDESAGRPADTWMLASSAGVAGMLADNLLNVSLHFAVPAFLFWWQVGMVMGRPMRREAGAAAQPLGAANARLAQGRSPPRRPDQPLEGESGSAPSKAQSCWRTLRFPHKAAALAAAFGVWALCAACGWWWIGQWNREVHYFLGFKLSHAGVLPQAIEELETAYRWHGRDVNADYELGNAYARSEEYPKAVWAYGEALKSNAGYDEIYFNLAVLLAQRLQRREEALKYYLTACAINPLSQDIYAGLGTFYLQEPEKYREPAVDLFEGALRYFPDQTSFMNNLGYLYRIGHEYGKAEDILAQALRLDPDFELARRNLEELARESKRPAPAVLRQVAAFRELEASIAGKDYSDAVLRKAGEVAGWFPKSAKARFYLGNLEMIHGRPQEALAQLEPLAAADPRNTALLRNLAELYLRLNRPQDAVDACRSILAVDPNDSYARGKLQALSTLSR